MTAQGRGTRLDPAYTRQFGVEELHGVFLQHRADPGGFCDAVIVQVPEASRREISAALAVAQASRARLAFFCDTGRQPRAMRRLALARLPEHRLVAQERAEAGAWGPRH